MAYGETPIVIITGMPGTGKSTLSRHLARQLKDRWTAVEVSLDDSLTIQCPIEKLDFNGTPLFQHRNGFFYLEDEWRPKQMELATAGLFALADFVKNLDLPRKGRLVFLMEFPLTEIERFTAKITDNANKWVGGVVLLHAERPTRSLRNDSRIEQRRLPDPVLTYFDKELDNVDVPRHCAELRKAGWPVIIESTDGQEQVVLERISTAVMIILAKI